MTCHSSPVIHTTVHPLGQTVDHSLHGSGAGLKGSSTTWWTTCEREKVHGGNVTSRPTAPGRYFAVTLIWKINADEWLSFGPEALRCSTAT